MSVAGGGVPVTDGNAGPGNVEGHIVLFVIVVFTTSCLSVTLFVKVGFVCVVQQDTGDAVTEAGRCNNPDDVVSESDRYNSVIIRQ